MKILKPNCTVRLAAWDHTSSAKFGTVRAYAAEKSTERFPQNPEAEFKRARENGHETAWAIHAGTVIDNSGFSFRQAKEQAVAAVLLEDGEVIGIEGEPETYQVRVMKGNESGPRNSDPIHFHMIPGYGVQPDPIAAKMVSYCAQILNEHGDYELGNL